MSSNYGAFRPIGQRSTFRSVPYDILELGEIPGDAFYPIYAAFDYIAFFATSSGDLVPCSRLVLYRDGTVEFSSSSGASSGAHGRWLQGIEVSQQGREVQVLTVTFNWRGDTMRMKTMVFRRVEGVNGVWQTIATRVAEAVIMIQVRASMNN